MQPKRKILVVDDEESIRYTFSHFLKEAGYEVFTASDLKGARKILFHTRLDLVFLDIVLGAESGLDLLKQLKSLLLKLPVVMITGKPTLDNATDALRRGAHSHQAGAQGRPCVGCAISATRPSSTRRSWSPGRRRSTAPISRPSSRA